MPGQPSERLAAGGNAGGLVGLPVELLMGLVGIPFLVLGRGSRKRGREDLILVFEAHSESEQDLALGIHAAVHALFDAVNGAKRDLGLPGQLRLRHEPVLAQLTYSVRTFPGVAHVAFPQSSRGSALWQLQGISDELRISLEKIGAWRIGRALDRILPKALVSRGDAASSACSRGLFEPKLDLKDAQLAGPARSTRRRRAAARSAEPVGGPRRGPCDER